MDRNRPSSSQTGALIVVGVILALGCCLVPVGAALFLFGVRSVAPRPTLPPPIQAVPPIQVSPQTLPPDLQPVPQIQLSPTLEREEEAGAAPTDEAAP